MAQNSIIQNRSKLKDFLASIATIRGDLSNITAPPFVLDTKSTVELPAFWADRPSVFVAAALQDDPKLRALAVLRWFLYSLRNQNYAGRQEQDGIKKPLNAFLGEVDLAQWSGKDGVTRLVSEQVRYIFSPLHARTTIEISRHSHHPPVTACRVWNDQHGISAEGFTQQEVTFNGRVNVKQSGFATLHIAKYDETYLIPLPDLKVKGILTGTPYPEIYGVYEIPASSGYKSTINFIGESFLGGNKHNFEARLDQSNGPGETLYTVKGFWNASFTITDEKTCQVIDTVDINHPPSEKPTPIISDNLRDPWETQRAWKDVREALDRGDMQATADAKSKVEKGQRKLRALEKSQNRTWQQLFFLDINHPDEATAKSADASYLSTVKSLLDQTSKPIHHLVDRPIWRFDHARWEKKFTTNQICPPFHLDIIPDYGQSDENTNPSLSSSDGRDNRPWNVTSKCETTATTSTTASGGISTKRHIDSFQNRQAIEDMLRDMYQSR